MQCVGNAIKRPTLANGCQEMLPGNKEPSHLCILTFHCEVYGLIDNGPSGWDARHMQMRLQEGIVGNHCVPLSGIHFRGNHD